MCRGPSSQCSRCCAGHAHFFRSLTAAGAPAELQHSYRQACPFLLRSSDVAPCSSVLLYRGHVLLQAGSEGSRNKMSL